MQDFNWLTIDVCAVITDRESVRMVPNLPILICSLTVNCCLDPIYTGLVTTAQVMYLLEICCLGWVFIILYDQV